MALTERQRAALRAHAEAEGLDADELIAAAEEPDEGDAGESKAAPGEPPKIFQYYHTPFLRVFEIRASIGFSERVEDDDMWSAEFLAKHGGVTGATPRTPTE